MNDLTLTLEADPFADLVLRVAEGAADNAHVANVIAQHLAPRTGP